MCSVTSGDELNFIVKMRDVKLRWYVCTRHWFHCCNVYSLALLFMLFCLVLLVINIYELRLIQADHAVLHSIPVARSSADDESSQRLPVVWVHGKMLEIGYMKHVFNVFKRIGFTARDSASDWDVLWSHDYPFKTLGLYRGNLKPHQKVNHFPGSGCLTNKVQLVLSEFSFIPKAFQLPSQKQIFLEYAKKNPKKLWVQKNNNHRGIKILSVEELDLDTANSFIQEYIADPFLIDKRRFDIGLYVTLTSVDPLRVYIYEGDWLIRFCSRDYHPFDRNDVGKYVITDDYTPLWEIASLAKFYKESDSTRKIALFGYLRKLGKDPDVLSRNLAAAIREVFYSKENNITRQTAHYSHRNFFEMVRFDFLVDEDLKVYLMEVNMSPNLSSEHFSGNKLLYEQVVFSLLRLVGIASAVRMDKSIMGGDVDAIEMQVSSRDLRVYTDNCTANFCTNCQAPVCRLCATCMNKDMESIITSAYLEHINRHTWKRIVPKPPERQMTAKSWNPAADVQFRRMSLSNQIMMIWFNGKCADDSTWCV